MDILNYIETIDTVVDNAEIESLYMLLEYYNKELTMSVYMEDGEIKKPEIQQANPQQSQQAQQNPSIFEKMWNGIKRLFEIVKNAFKKFIDLFKKKSFTVDTVPDNEKQNLAETFKNAAAGNDTSSGNNSGSGNWTNHPVVQKSVESFRKLKPNVPIQGIDIENNNLYFYTQDDNTGKWTRHPITIKGGLPQDLIQLYQQQNGDQSVKTEAALVSGANNIIGSGIQAGSRIGSLTGNNKAGVATGAGVGALRATGVGVKTVTKAIGFPVGFLAGFALGTVFNICATFLEQSIVKSIKTLPSPEIVNKAGKDLLTQNDAIYSILTTKIKLDTDVNDIMRPLLDYNKHAQLDHSGENCIVIMDRWLKRVNDDPILSGKRNNTTQATLTSEQLQLVTDAAIYVEMLNKENGDHAVLVVIDNLNYSFDKFNQYVQSPNCIVNKIPFENAKKFITDILTKNAKNCLSFINCLNSINVIGTTMWKNINGAKQRVN